MILGRVVSVFLGLGAFASLSVAGERSAWLQGFLENRGQWSEGLRYRSWAGQEAVYLEREAITLERIVESDPLGSTRAVLRLALEGGSGSEPRPGERLSGLHHFFLGRDPGGWVRDVRWYGSVEYPDAAPGVDLVVRAARGGFEYDVRVRPGGRLDRLVFRCEGAERLWVEGDGSLCAEVGGAVLRQTRPRTWVSSADGDRSAVRADYRLLEGCRFGLAVPGLSPGDTALIDPGLVWSTFLSGTQIASPYGLTLSIHDMEVSEDGSVTLIGETGLSDLPVTPGSFQDSYQGGSTDVCVLRLGPGGDEFVFGTYLGGPVGMEVGYGLDVPPDGSVLVTGLAKKFGFPVTPGAFTAGAMSDSSVVFVSWLVCDGSALKFSSVFGGEDTEEGRAVRFAEGYGVTVTGSTESNDFPVTAGAFDKKLGGDRDAFVMRLTEDGSTPIFCTFMGGTSVDWGGAKRIVVDQAGRTIMGGTTNSADLPLTPGAFISSYGGLPTAFLARLNSAGTDLDFSTYLNATGWAAALSVAFHPLGWITVFGGATDFPVTPGTFESFTGAAENFFVGHFSLDGTTLHRGLMIGTPNADFPGAMDLDSAGNVYICGNVNNGVYPVTPGTFDPTHNEPVDVVISKLDPPLSKLLYSTYLGGTGQTGVGRSLVRVQNTGDVTVSATTTALDFPVTHGSYMTQSTFPPIVPTFITRLDMLPVGADRIGEPTWGCDGPPAIGVTKMPKAGASDFGLVCMNVPKGVVGMLGASLSPAPRPVYVSEAAMYLDPSWLALLPVVTDGLGTTKVLVKIKAEDQGKEAVFQYFFPDACAPGGVSASAALRITAQ